MAGKGRRRVKNIKAILETLKSTDDIYDIIDYRNASETKIKQFMYHPLIKTLSQIIKDTGYRKDCVQHAKNVLLWESNKGQTLNNVTLFNVQHRPDFVVNMKNYNIAIEIKRGKNGSDLRSGLGQCVVYSKCYDYVVYLFVDTSSDKRIRDSLTQKKEKEIVDDLWKSYNVLFDCV